MRRSPAVPLIAVAAAVTAALTGCGGGHAAPKPAPSRTPDSALESLKSQQSLVTTVRRAAPDPDKATSCDSLVLDSWEQRVAGFVVNGEHFPAVADPAHPKTTTSGQPEVYAKRFSAGRAFLDPSSGRLVDGADAAQTRAYDAWLVDPAVVHKAYQPYQSFLLGYLDGGGSC
ncbi:hypothetical protein OG896_28175 [Streptomyces sp. NBC_00669]|uniref:hypothetical protein n=1 Tax=Streptomyces sp. NBC_00669 TaxID=2976011 RepID=UPI002E339CF5|nr:hypothetical protein [Streptomyces sp. NBC_00669]